MTNNQEPEEGLAAAGSCSFVEDKECEVQGEIIIETKEILETLLLVLMPMPEKMDGLVERLKDHPSAKEVTEMTSSLKIALKLIEKQNQMLEVKDEIISDLKKQVEVVKTLKNQTEELADINEVLQKDEYDHHIAVALEMVSKLQGELEVAQNITLERVTERQKFEDEILMRKNNITDLESKMKDVNRKLMNLREENQDLRKKLEKAVNGAYKSSSYYEGEIAKCYMQDVKASEEIQKYKRIIGCVEDEIEQLNKLCGKCKTARVEKQIDILRTQMGLSKLNVDATEKVPGKLNPGSCGGSRGPKCVVCGDPFSRELDITDYIRMLIISAEIS